MIAPRSIRRQAGVFLGLACLCAVLLGATLDRVTNSDDPPLTPVTPAGKWLRASGDLDYSGAFRQTISLPSPPKNAWLMISAQDAFEVIVNGKSAGHIFLWRPTRKFDYGLSEFGQWLSRSLPMLSSNYPREYQWESYRSYLLPVYLDLTPFLVAGENSICVTVESRSAPARFNLSGEIVEQTGERLAITSDATWRTSVAPQHSESLDWSLPHFDDQSWAHAVETSAPPGQCLRRLDPAIFQREFAGRWLQAAAPAGREETCFETDWPLASVPRDAWVRVVGNRSYDLFVNGRRVSSENPRTATLDAGNWIVGMETATDITTSAETIEDESGTLRSSNGFLPPPRSDEARKALPVSPITRLHTHPYDPSTGNAQEAGNGSVQAPPLMAYAPPERVPAALERDRQTTEFNAYSIGRLLRAGTNHLSIRLLPSESVPALDWSPQVALDAGATLRDGAQSSLASGPAWETVFRDETGRVTRAGRAVARGAARQEGRRLPALQYRGFVFDRDQALWRWAGWIGGAGLLLLGTALTLLWRHPAARSAWLANGERSPAAEARLRTRLVQGTEILLLPTVVLGAAFLLQAAWAEREEILWFHARATWAAVLAGALLLALWTAARLLTRPPEEVSPPEGAPRRSWLERAPDTAGWKAVVCGLLALFFFLSAHSLDFQPIDDDEYASIEASVAIARHGVPKYTDEVWYTRSPLYHYLDGAIIAVCGENLWAMRLPSVLFGVATAWLLYHCGRRLLGSPWVGLGALCLFVIHPFTLFSAHIARFYQEQQFFALLTIYCFCRGFVTAQSMRFRYATLLSLLCTVLSQELSVVLGCQLALGYLLFAQKKPWRDEIRLLIVAGCMLALIATDILVFLTRCQTRMEGVAPTVEPTLHPHFSSPLYFFSLFLAYSRLHLALSVLFMLGLPFAFRSRHRLLLVCYYFTFSGVLFVNLLVTGIGFRYSYWLLPIWLLLAVWGIKAVVTRFCLGPEHGLVFGRAQPVWTRGVAAAVLFATAVLSFSPWHIPGSYQSKLLGDSTGAFQFVRSNLRPGDRVAATEPHPHGALLEVGRADFDLSFPRLYDFVYLKHGKLVDRNAEAESVSSIDELQNVLAQHDRVWFVVYREKFRSRGQDIGWDYPNGRPELFLRRNCRIAYQSYLWTVFLWDAHNGNYFDYRAHVLP